MNTPTNIILQHCLDLLKRNDDLELNLQLICEQLNQEMKHYNWVGFYFMNEPNQTLHLGPFTGAPTEHKIIPYGKGICGQVALSGETYLAPDITTEGNYIACSIDVKSEIVLPLYVKDTLVAQLDIDSHTVNAFNEKDEALLGEMLAAISRTFPTEILKLRNKLIANHIPERMASTGLSLDAK